MNDETKLLSLDEMREALKSRRLIIVAHQTNLSYPTIKAIVDGKANPKYETLKLISDYLQGAKNAK